MADNQKSAHYWRIHRKVTQKAWRGIDGRDADVIAADVDHETREFRRFESFVNSETERLYNDPELPYNDPATFKVSYRRNR